MPIAYNGTTGSHSSMRRGFAEPVFDSQRLFRAAAMAMARPGVPQQIDDRQNHALGLPHVEGVHAASLAWLLALADIDTPVWLDERLRDGVLPQYLRFHTGAEITAVRQQASFALFGADYQGAYFEGFPIGLDAYPEQSATLIVQTSALTSGSPHVIRGPGVPTTITLRIDGIGEHFWEAWHMNHAHYPCGVDVVFTAGRAVMGLPRSAVEEG